MNLRGTLLQPWNWHTPRLDGAGLNLWQRLERDAQRYADLRFTAIWLPPASKGVGGNTDVGYGVRDWYDLHTYALDAEGRCRACQTPLPGRFAATPGTWGRKRLPVAMG